MLAAQSRKSKRVFDAPGAAQLVGDLGTGLIEGAGADRVADFVDAEAKSQHNTGDDPITTADAEVTPIETATRRRWAANRPGSTRRMCDHAHKINRSRLT